MFDVTSKYPGTWLNPNKVKLVPSKKNNKLYLVKYYHNDKFLYSEKKLAEDVQQGMSQK